MTIEERVKLAEEKHHSGYNCAQAVLCSYSDKLGIDEETLFRLKGIETGKVLRSCDGCIEDAVRIAERLFS